MWFLPALVAYFIAFMFTMWTLVEQQSELEAIRKKVMPRKIADRDDPPRPPCACGNPATAQVEVIVRRLMLERDSGARSEAYWMPSYRNTTTNVTAVICDTCVTNHVKISLAVSATVDKAKPQS